MGRELNVLNQDGTLGKQCTVCGEWKLLNEYYNDKRKKDGKESKCKECRIKKEKRYYKNNLDERKIYYEKNKDKISQYSKIYRKSNKEKIVDKDKNYYDINKKRILINRKEYYSKNRDACNSRAKAYFNKNRNRVYELKRRIDAMREAFKKNLPNCWKVEEHEEMINKFNNKCALTDDERYDFDHVIPLSIGHGGTYDANIIPLRHDVNVSKRNFNIFEWFESKKEWYGLSEERFYKLMEFIAEKNCLTTDEYKKFVCWCHDNKRTIEETEFDKRFSIEIWREAEGIHFPLPKYTSDNYGKKGK